MDISGCLRSSVALPFMVAEVVRLPFRVMVGLDATRAV